jgi:phosphatidylglycerol:prolipoprotein diacylglycerol transferase
VIPYVEINPIKIWILPALQPFGILLAIGVLFGSWMMRKYLDRYKMDDETMRWLVIRMLIWGFVICHLVNTFFYEPERLREDPLLVFKVWDGISSFGGIVGGFIAFLFYTRKWHQMIRLRWSDAWVYGLVPGFMFGRMGCAIVHDHIGVATDFPLAVNFDKPRHLYGVIVEGPHHDLGLYEVPLLFAIWMAVLLIEKKRDRPDGLITAFVALAYAVPRFFLEFLRLEVTDPRRLGLTPAQYMAILMAGAGLWILYRIFVKKQFSRVTDPELHKIEPKPRRGGDGEGASNGDAGGGAPDQAKPAGKKKKPTP